MLSRKLATVAVLLALGGCGTEADQTDEVEKVQSAVVSPDVKPNGRGIGIHQQWEKTAGKRPGGGNGISYHGGPLMLGTPNVYYIWYGNWSTASGADATAILTDLASNIGGSPYYNINTTYHGWRVGGDSRTPCILPAAPSTITRVGRRCPMPPSSAW